MQKFSCIEEIQKIHGNTIIGIPKEMVNSNVELRGKNNIMYFDDNVSLHDSSIRFYGDNNVVFISSSVNHKTRLNVAIYNNSAFYIGKEASTTRTVYIVLSEGKNIIIGDSCLFSFGTWFRNSDPHLIYDIKTGNRINESKSIYLGDHIWVGQEVLVSKGTKVGSGSIIGAKAFTGGKTFPSNSSIGGVPCKVIKNNIFWLKPAVHAYTAEDTRESLTCDEDTYIYSADSNRLSFDVIEKELENAGTSVEKLEVLKKYLYNNENKNRFFIPVEKKRKSLFAR